MKKNVMLLSATTLIAMASFAQVVPSANKGGFMVKGGVNFANVTVTDNGRVDDAKNLTSFNVGIGADVPLSNNFSLQPGVLLTGKGAKTQFGQTSDANYWKSTSNPMYVEVPVNLVGKIHLTPASNFFVGVGPYAAVGVGGKNKVEGKLLGASFEREDDINFSDDDPTTSAEENAGYGKLKRFDYGFNTLVGVQFSKFSVNANYGYGLAKINSNTDNNADDKGKNRVLSLSVGIGL